MRLYRGDSLRSSLVRSDRRAQGRTFPRHFCGTGLMAKFADGGASTLVDSRALLQVVLEHVGHERRSPAQALADHSPLISFSASLDRAWYFCESDEDKREALEKCFFAQATHFVFEMELAGADLSELPWPGAFLLTYQSDPVNCRPITREQLDHGWATNDLDLLVLAVGDLCAQDHAESDNSKHYAVLVDVVRYVSARRFPGDLLHGDQRLIENTLECASRDSEWLLYPADLIPDGRGTSARFAMNRHLKCLGPYRVRG